MTPRAADGSQAVLIHIPVYRDRPLNRAEARGDRLGRVDGWPATRFNPRPAPKHGATNEVVGRLHGSHRFNPRPALRHGAT